MAAAVTALAAMSVACFQPVADSCAVQCSAAEGCPAGLTCDQGLCRDPNQDRSCRLASDAGPGNDAASDPDAALPLDLADGFEDGIPAGWDRLFSNGDACEVSQESSVEGQASLRCATDALSGAQAALGIDIPPSTELHVRLQVRYASVPDTFLSLVQLASVDEQGRVAVTMSSDFYQDRRMDVWSYDTKGSAKTEQALELDRWYPIDLWAITDEAGVAGELKLAIDGEPGPSISGSTLGRSGAINRIFIGIPLQYVHDNPNVVFIDDVVITPEAN